MGADGARDGGGGTLKGHTGSGQVGMCLEGVGDDKGMTMGREV
jgi:hypothetical protein